MTDQQRCDGVRVVLAPDCRCSHPESAHNIGTRAGREVRTACSRHTGPQATPCGCRQYEPGEAS